MKMTNCSILVTGGCGFVGHHLVNRMIKEPNLKIVIVDNLSNSNDHFMKEISSSNDRNSISVNLADGDLKFYNEDIRNERSISEIVKQEGITQCIHLAAKTSVKESFESPGDVMDVNVNGTLNIIKACCKNHVRSFVFASSAAVYGNPGKLPIEENMPLRPISPYGASKVAAEALLSKYAKEIRNNFCLRFFNIYGRGQNSAYAGVITKFILRLAKRLPVIIYGDGSQTRDFVYVEDVVESILLACRNQSHFVRTSYHKWRNYEILNIGTGKPVSIIDLAKIMQEIVGMVSVKPIFRTTLPGDIMHSYPKINRAKGELGYKPSVHLKYGLALTMKDIIS